MKMRLTGHLLMLLVAVLLMACGEKVEESQTLGTIHFDPTGKKEALPDFSRGMLLLHSFEYQDAATAFRKAREKDPGFVMAYWGEAMTKNHTLWSEQYTDEAAAILQELAPTRAERLALAATPIERDFLEGVEILYGEGEKLERDKAYAAHMEQMHNTYPGNQEVAAFYALSLLGSVTERDVDVYEKSARIAQGILDENPQHPGALHYTIHSYDDPGHAHLALDVAYAYSNVAPDAGHALHMPSHIFIAMGMWDEVIRSNIAAYEAGNARVERLDLDHDARNYHALFWLMYAYQQRGQDSLAYGLLGDMQRYASELPSDRARAHLTLMRATYQINAPKWREDLMQMEVDDAGLNIGIRSVNDFMEGLQAYRNENPQQLTQIIQEMADARTSEKKRMIQRGAAMCSGVSGVSQLPNQQDINQAYVMEMELNALLAMLHGEEQQAEMWFTQAVALEEETSFAYGPPPIVKPSHELYAEWLSDKDPDAAKQHYDKVLERAPGRRLSEMGKAGLTAI